MNGSSCASRLKICIFEKSDKNLPPPTLQLFSRLQTYSFDSAIDRRKNEAQARQD
jgi:hypothetical protein